MRGRRDVAERGQGRRLAAEPRGPLLVEELRAGRDRRLPPEADELLSPPCPEHRPGEPPAPDVAAVRTQHPLEAEVEGGGPPVDLRPRDVPLLDPQDPHRLGPVGRDAVRGPPLQETLPDRGPPVGGRMDLVAQLPRERDPEHPDRDAAEGRFQGPHEGERPDPFAVAAVHRGDEDLAAPRPRERHPRPLVGHVHDGHVEAGPHRLRVELHVPEHVAVLAGGGGHVVAALVEPGGGPVVEDVPVLAQHEAVAAPPDPERPPPVDVHPLQELRDVVARELDLAEGGDVHDPDRLPDVAGFAPGGLDRGLAFAGIGMGAEPEPDRAHGPLDAAGRGDVPVVHRGLADRGEARSGLLAGEETEGDRRVGGAVGGVPGLGNGRAARAGEEGEAVHVARPALVGAHAEGGVALEVLDRRVALARRERDVGRGHVVLEVDERLGVLRSRNRPERLPRRGRGLLRGARGSRGSGGTRGVRGSRRIGGE